MRPWCVPADGVAAASSARAALANSRREISIFAASASATPIRPAARSASISASWSR